MVANNLLTSKAWLLCFNLFLTLKVVLFCSRIAVNFAGSPVELNFKSADKDLPQPFLCKRKGTVVDVLV